MKKLLYHIASSLVCLVLLFLFCTLLSIYARNSVDALEALMDELPEPDAADVLMHDDKAFKALLHQVISLEEQTKKAGCRLAFFIHYSYISRAGAAAGELKNAVLARSPAQYGEAKNALREALDSLRRLEDPTLELFL